MSKVLVTSVGLSLAVVFGAAAFATHETQATFDGVMTRLTGDGELVDGKLVYTNVTDQPRRGTYVTGRAVKLELK